MSIMECIGEYRAACKWAKKAVAAARLRDEKKNRECDLSTSLVVECLYSQNFRCGITNTRLVVDSPEKTKHRFAPSIDRIDNLIGYTMNNIHITSVFANFARRDAPLDKFISEFNLRFKNCRVCNVPWT